MLEQSDGSLPVGLRDSSKREIAEKLVYDPFVLVCKTVACNCLSSCSLLVLIPFVRALRKVEETLLLIIVSLLSGANRTGKGFVELSTPLECRHC